MEEAEAQSRSVNFFFFFLTLGCAPHSMWDLVPQTGIKLTPMHWKVEL